MIFPEEIMSYILQLRTNLMLNDIKTKHKNKMKSSIEWIDESSKYTGYRPITSKRDYLRTLLNRTMNPNPSRYYTCFNRHIFIFNIITRDLNIYVLVTGKYNINEIDYGTIKN